MTAQMDPVELVDDGSFWRVKYRTGGMHMFPKDALEWRAVEYGVDPADVDALLDIVLHEPYLTPVVEAAAWRLGRRLATLYEAGSQREAREDHRARIAHLKATVVRIPIAGVAVLDPVRAHHLAATCPESRAVKEAHVSRTRARMMGGSR